MDTPGHLRFVCGSEKTVRRVDFTFFEVDCWDASIGHSEGSYLRTICLPKFMNACANSFIPTSS